MLSHELETRARDFVEALSLALPPLQFLVYVDQETPSEDSGLYIFGFATHDVLIGGYAIEPERVGHDFTHHLLSISQFFQKARKTEGPHFFPEALATRYAIHRERGTLWQRVA